MARAAPASSSEQTAPRASDAHDDAPAPPADDAPAPRESFAGAVDASGCARGRVASRFLGNDLLGGHSRCTAIPLLTLMVFLQFVLTFAAVSAGNVPGAPLSWSAFSVVGLGLFTYVSVRRHDDFAGSYEDRCFLVVNPITGAVAVGLHLAILVAVATGRDADWLQHWRRLRARARGARRLLEPRREPRPPGATFAIHPGFAVAVDGGRLVVGRVGGGRGAVKLSDVFFEEEAPAEPVAAPPPAEPVAAAPAAEPRGASFRPSSAARRRRAAAAAALSRAAVLARDTSVVGAQFFLMSLGYIIVENALVFFIFADGYRAAARAFAVAYASYVAYGLLVGAALFVSRVLTSVVFCLFHLASLDVCVLPERYAHLDASHVAFMSLVYAHRRHHDAALHVAAEAFAARKPRHSRARTRGCTSELYAWTRSLPEDRALTTTTRFRVTTAPPDARRTSVVAPRAETPT
ncbi:hypothetical protein SO694_00041160 [Aureococcus anophagefferens]|uniref:Uncharacterized protein n=1 Tax=Aureococcus anophagefferens TaxID=44056 RepID=A0ABR1G634_AURAN